jgi:Ca2+-binding RTX toxin-like protein
MVSESFLDAGPDGNPGDGNDVVFVSGIVDTVHASLGSGDDLYVSGAVLETNEGGSGLLVDIVYGGEGNDAIATYLGDDTLFGGEGNDVLWGGDNDFDGNVIYGGSGTDYLYDGDSSNDQMFGGEGTDYYYWAMYQNNGGGDQIFEQHRLGQESDGTTNYLVVFGIFDTEETPSDAEPVPDYLRNGFGVFQSSHDLVNPLVVDDGVNFFSDPLQLIDNEDGTWTLYSEYTNGNITFDPDDIATIVLWNNDAASLDPDYSGPPGTPVMTFYNWNGVTYVYSETPN